MAEVKYICKRTAVSTKPVQPGQYHALTALDRAMEHNQLKLVYYYNTQFNWKGGEMTKMLLESLSETLNNYQIVTGRMVRANDDHDGKWIVKCNDAGVRMVEARAKGSVEEWLRNVDREKELMLVHWEEMYYKPYFWSTFYVQITEFEVGGGLAIGLSSTHLLADPTSVTRLIKAWADVTLTGEMVAPPLFSSVLPQNSCKKAANHQSSNNLINHYKSSIHKSISMNDVKHATITLAFNDQMVQACMSMVNEHLPIGAVDDPIPSPFEALAGLFWFCTSKVKGIKDGLMNMSISLDMRKVIGLEKGYFGNCMVYTNVNNHAKGMKENGLLIEASNAIRETVTKIDKGGIMELIEWLDNTDDQHCPSMSGCDLICANLEDVETYVTVFEDGFEPIRVSCYIEPVFGQGQVLILPSRAGEGPLSRVVMVSLPEDEIVRLIEDDLIRYFSPTIVMGVNNYHAA